MSATAAIVGLSALTVSNTISQRETILTGGTVAQSLARRDARISRLQGAQVIRRGEGRVSIIRGRQKQLAGTQRANLAAQGIDPRSGTGAAVIVESRLFGDLDIIETRNNARLEALGFESQALTAEGRGEFARLAAKAEARQTILTGALQIARDFALFGAFKSPSKKPPRKTAIRGVGEARRPGGMFTDIGRTRRPTESNILNLGFAQ